VFFYKTFNYLVPDADINDVRRLTYLFRFEFKLTFQIVCVYVCVCVAVGSCEYKQLTSGGYIGCFLSVRHTFSVVPN